MKPKNTSLVAVLFEGNVEAREVAAKRKMAEGERLEDFAWRMAIRLEWAVERIEELEDAAFEEFLTS